jgi:hypothetical protein
LSLEDRDTSMDVYDAHVCSSAAPCVSVAVSAPECSSGDACKPAPLLQPAIFGAPSSATFSGAGNPRLVVSPRVSVNKAAKPAKHKRKRTRKRRAGKHGGRSGVGGAGMGLRVGGGGR